MVSQSFKALWKGLLTLAVSTALFVFIVATYGVETTKWTCQGEFVGQLGTRPAVLYALIDRYRWFIFWSDHGAMITWEIQPNIDVGHGYIAGGDSVNLITDFNRTRLLGDFSPLSGTIHVVTFREEDFRGTCALAP